MINGENHRDSYAPKSKHWHLVKCSLSPNLCDWTGAWMPKKHDIFCEVSCPHGYHLLRSLPPHGLMLVHSLLFAAASCNTVLPPRPPPVRAPSLPPRKIGGRPLVPPLHPNTHDPYWYRAETQHPSTKTWKAVTGTQPRMHVNFLLVS